MAGRFGSYCKRCFCCFGNLRDPGFLFCCRAARTAAQLEILLTVSARYSAAFAPALDFMTFLNR